MDKYNAQIDILDRITELISTIKRDEHLDRFILAQKLEEIWDDVNYYL